MIFDGIFVQLSPGFRNLSNITPTEPMRCHKKRLAILSVAAILAACSSVFGPRHGLDPSTKNWNDATTIVAGRTIRYRFPPYPREFAARGEIAHLSAKREDVRDLGYYYLAQSDEPAGLRLAIYFERYQAPSGSRTTPAELLVAIESERTQRLSRMAPGTYTSFGILQSDLETLPNGTWVHNEYRYSQDSSRIFADVFSMPYDQDYRLVVIAMYIDAALTADPSRSNSLRQAIRDVAASISLD